MNTSHSTRRLWRSLALGVLAVCGILAFATLSSRASSNSGSQQAGVVSADGGFEIPEPGSSTKAGGELSRRNRPDMAVSIGDSYISGEGAEDFITGDGFDDYIGTFPGWDSAEQNSYFCHRSRNSSIFAAELDGIEKRRAIACSGGRPRDVWNVPHADRRTGRDPQIDYLRTAAQQNDIDVILVGLGANTRHMTFGSVMTLCHAGFMFDAADASIEVLSNIQLNHEFETTYTVDQFILDIRSVARRNGCDRSDLPSDADFGLISDAVERAISDIIDMLAQEGYRDGEYKIVLQGYTNPFTPDIKGGLIFERDGVGTKKYDTNGSFNRLAIERYEAGCALHIKSMATADLVSDLFYDMQIRAITSLRQTYPDADIVHMDVRDAIAHDEKLCAERSPNGALSNPIWFRDQNNEIQREFPGTHLDFFFAWKSLANRCGGDDGHFARCQESGHPNEAGHARLGECLSKVVSTDRTNVNVNCFRSSKATKLTTVSP